jgi:spermidine/putrescine-binding protein
MESAMRENKIFAMAAVFMICLAFAGCKKEKQADAQGAVEKTDPLSMETELDILALEGRIESGKNSSVYDWVTPFENATGCKVKAVLVDGNELFASHLENGKFDLVIAADQFLPIDQFQPIDFSRLRSFNNLDRRFLENAPVKNRIALPLHWKLVPPVAPSTEFVEEVESTHLSKKAANVNCAYAWMEWTLSPKVQADIAAALDTIPAVPAACIGNELLGDEACQARMSPSPTLPATSVP